jgi:hypothetical protein
MLLSFRDNRITEWDLVPYLKPPLEIESKNTSVSPLFPVIDRLTKVAVLSLAWVLTIRPYLVYGNCFQYTLDFNDMSDAKEQLDSIIDESGEYFLRYFQENLHDPRLVQEAQPISKEEADGCREKVIRKLEGRE